MRLPKQTSLVFKNMESINKSYDITSSRTFTEQTFNDEDYSAIADKYATTREGAAAESIVKKPRKLYEKADSKKRNDSGQIKQRKNCFDISDRCHDDRN